MMADALGITFSESMSGGFAFGVADPEAGARRGKDFGTDLILRATITIPDLNAFISNELHSGDLIGNIEFSGWGNSVSGDNGQFFLFLSDPERKQKLMVYETNLSRGDEKFYLVGKKYIHHNHAPEILLETTTLFTVLHAGSNDQGAIVGAGILTLGAEQLMSMTHSIRVLNAKSALDTTRAMTKFLRFFLGELWESYVT
jgi:hypothetical protein